MKNRGHYLYGNIIIVLGVRICLIDKCRKFRHLSEALTFTCIFFILYENLSRVIMSKRKEIKYQNLTKSSTTIALEVL